MKPVIINPKSTTILLPEFVKTPIFFLSIILIVLTLAVYWQVGNHPFLNFDDEYYVTDNVHVANGITFHNFIWAFTSVEAANWHPVTWLSHLADVQFYGMNPRGHHLTNLAIHTLTALLLFFLLFRLTTGVWESFIVATLFALHPLHVESVAWIAERKDVLSAFFWFLTLLIYTEYVVKLKASLYILALFLFILGLMSKPMLVTLPIIMLLLDFWPLDRYRYKEREGVKELLKKIVPFVIEKIPFFVCSLLSTLVTIYAQHNGDAIASLSEIPFLFRLENALISYTKYIGKTFWPFDLAVYYPLPLVIPFWQVISSLFILLFLTFAVIRLWNRYPCFLVGWFWFLITLLPVIGIIQVGSQSMADRYSYIPITGLFIMLIWGVLRITQDFQHKKVVLATLACVVIAVLSTLTWKQLGYWRENISLYKHTIQVTTDNYLIYSNLGLALAAAGDLDAAISTYKEASRINPDYFATHNNMALAFIGKGDFDAAVNECREALRISPNDSSAHNNLGLALASRGDLNNGIIEFSEAVRIDKNNAKAHNNLGLALARKGGLEAGIREFREALRINPNDEDALYNLELSMKRIPQTQLLR